MCLAIPAIVLSRSEDHQAIVELDGVRKQISLMLTPEAEPGDYVIVHVGYAIGLLDPEEAEQTLMLFGELAASQATGKAATT
jgi:hydrogenase expression/formation protein HypC